MYSRPDRLRDIANRFNLDHSAMLDNVLYARAYTSEYLTSKGCMYLGGSAVLRGSAVIHVLKSQFTYSDCSIVAIGTEIKCHANLE